MTILESSQKIISHPSITMEKTHKSDTDFMFESELDSLASILELRLISIGLSKTNPLKQFSKQSFRQATENK